jgi:ABC-2 type transport system permease protein
MGCVFVLTRRGGQIFSSIQEPVDFLSGLRFPVRILPGILQSVASILPLTYGIRATRLAMIGGATLAEVWADLLTLAVMGVLLVLSSRYLVRVIERRAKREGTLSLF